MSTYEDTVGSGYGAFFSADGPLAGRLAAFAPRPQQQAMAEAVGRVLDTGGCLAVEAGTGVGKTFAYLVPALLSGRRVIISTGTRNLQDQLFKRDLPLVAEAIGAPVRTALLKGRSNYLCLHRLDIVDAASGAGRHLARIRAWAQVTESGDVAELPEVPEQAAVWPQVTSTVDNCLGSDCPVFNRCHVVRARRQAQEADVVVVNHHLLLADMALKEQGFGDLLPAGDACILDEAHQVPEIAARFFGASAAAGQLSSLARDVIAEAVNAGVLEPELDAAAASLKKAVADARLLFEGTTGRHAWEELGDRPGSLCTRLVGELDAVGAAIDAYGGGSPGLEGLGRRAADLAQRLAGIRDGEDDGVRWLDISTRGFALHLTPFDTSAQLRAVIEGRPGAWVFTSATLAVAEDFAHFLDRVGVPDATTLRLDSPFDFANNALLYLPRDLPAPSAGDFTARMIERALPLIESAGGRTFVLFTSHRALREAATILRERLGPLPLLVQGDAPRDELLRQFRRLGNAVLLGTSSFWEGVDVRGDALSLVVIDKLPFASPSDPVLKARMAAIRASGGQPFRDYQLPQAVLALKQGVGRLIRDVTDMGVCMLCDPRLTSHGYGKVFLRSLPPMPVTDDSGEVVAFLQQCLPPAPVPVS